MCHGVFLNNELNELHECMCHGVFLNNELNELHELNE